MKRTEKSIANSRPKSRANSRQDMSRANSKQDKSRTNSRQVKPKGLRPEDKAKHEEKHSKVHGEVPGVRRFWPIV